jgi:DMSO/TMAO reductase YedYZ molybdopterin-dependent catalytic subunit
MPPLPPNQQLAAPGKWPVVGEKQAASLAGAWTVEIAGLAARPTTWSLAQLRALPQTDRQIDIHCVTRWSKLGCRFGGVPLLELLALAEPAADAQYLSFVAHSPRQHSTSLPLAVVRRLEPLVALSYEGRELAAEHGGPVRVVVPGLYFYKSLKWLARIELLAQDRLGYWEAQAGYHNGADPWREERYMAATLSRHEAAQVLASRDFAGRDLRSIDARGRDLSGLSAKGALLRDADFRGCNLQRANFDGANLSNARLQGADLRGASFREADVEGADFCGANLRGADFRGASLLGATFTAGELAANIDASTHFDAEQLDDLAPPQCDFIRVAMAR